MPFLSGPASGFGEPPNQTKPKKNESAKNVIIFFFARFIICWKYCSWKKEKKTEKRLDWKMCVVSCFDTRNNKTKNEKQKKRHENAERKTEIGASSTIYGTFFFCSKEHHSCLFLSSHLFLFFCLLSRLPLSLVWFKFLFCFLLIYPAKHISLSLDILLLGIRYRHANMFFFLCFYFFYCTSLVSGQNDEYIVQQDINFTSARCALLCCCLSITNLFCTYHIEKTN